MIRARLVAYGLCAVMAGGIVAFLAIVTFDRFLWLPAALRIFVAWLFFAGLVGSVWHWIVKPLRAPLTIEAFAGRLEQHFGHFDDRLTSTVDFLQHDAPKLSPMMRQLVVNTEQIMRDVPLESALTLKPVVRSVAVLLVGACVLTGILLFSPAWARTGLYRYVDPLGPVEWPRTVQIAPLSFDQAVAVGESATLGMRIVRGLTDTLRGVVQLREPDGTATALAMQRDEDGGFYTTIDSITQDLECWFEAGDDSTRRHPLRIRAVRRPAVVEALVTVEPPPYASARGVRIHDLGDGAVEAPIGGYVTVAVTSSKPVPLGDPHVGLRLSDGAFIPLMIDPANRRNLRVRTEVSQSWHPELRFRIELRDEEGFENRGALQRSIVAVPDSPPMVTILHPRAVTEVTPRLSVRVEDDFGVSRLELHAQQPQVDEVLVTSLADKLVISRNADRVEAVADYLWPVAPMSLVPGDNLLYTVVAYDNRTVDGVAGDDVAGDDEAGQMGRSTTMRLRIISDIECEMRLRDDTAVLEDRIREAVLDETELLDETAALVREGDAPAVLDDAQREVVASLAQRQTRLERRVTGLAGRFGELVLRVARNQASGVKTKEQVAALGDALGKVAVGPMASAGRRLQEARGHADGLAQQDALRAALGDEELATQRLLSLIRTIGQWGNFRALLSKTQDVLDRQRAVRNETGVLGRSMLGKSVASLTSQELTALGRTRRRQEQLVTDVDQLLEHMRRLASASSDKDPSGAQAAQSALRAAQANGVSRHLRDAAAAIGVNRTAGAMIEQKRAEEGLRRTLDALKERDTRELARLRKSLRRAEESVAQLIDEQKTLRAATHEAGLLNADDNSYEVLERQQRQLRLNAELLGEELAQIERIAAAGRGVRQSAKPMGVAARALGERLSDRAKAKQDEALALLQEALRRLDEIARQTEEEQFQRSLAEIHDDLSEMLRRQLAVNEGIAKLKEDVEQRGPRGSALTRTQARRASRLSRQQREARRLVDDVLGDLDEVKVYKWALDRVAGWMDQGRRRLDARRIDDELLRMTDRIVRDLRNLVQAIVETQAMPITAEFAEAEGGGGGGAGMPMQSKPVPTVAELLVLKAMQRDVNERTQRLNQSFDPTTADEQELADLMEIAEDQTEVRRLAELLTEKTHGP